MIDVRQSVPVCLYRCRRALGTSLRRLRDESGSAIVELGLSLSIVGVPLLLGTVHFGTLLMDSIAVSNAAHAGAEYAMESSNDAQNTALIQSTAQDDSGMGTNLTVTSTPFYVCSTAIAGTQYTTAALAATPCSASHVLEFVQVVASDTVTPPLTFPGAANSVTLTGKSIMEVEE